ncbi:hypothetical protein [Luteolibacter sp. LG18]|uniref:hypothetical protein n=1 Tax=Luteolibacter sp. LG18 TaxID=2819286 RepID=UPI002B28FD7E|nr:hypothetical protein llg_44320 [Luteolibacter sp. LG18]
MANKKPGKGKRYTAEEKQQIVDFVREANGDKGRGGVAAAVKKFGVSALTVASWVKAEGGVASKPGKAGKAAAKGGDGARSKLLGQLASLDHEIAARRKELTALEAKFQKLKQQL